jgi:hypothetical protein
VELKSGIPLTDDELEAMALAIIDGIYLLLD